MLLVWHWQFLAKLVKSRGFYVETAAAAPVPTGLGRNSHCLFDGGGHETEKKADFSTNQSKTKTLAKYSEFHQSCMDIQMTM